MSRIKEYVEAVLFVSGEGITLDEIAKKTKSDPIIVKKAINELNKEYESRKSAFFIDNEGEIYRMRLRNDFNFLIQDNLRTDMKQGVLMTLSVIATHGKIKQSELVKLRGSIVYKHIKELLTRGFITVYKENNQKIIKLAQTFFDYFDVNKDDLKEINKKLEEEIKKSEDQNVEYKGN